MRKLKWLIVPVALMLCASIGWADTISVSTWSEIQPAIDGATGPRTVQFDADMAAASTVNVNKADITIDGNGHRVTATVSVGYVFYITANTATIENLTLEKTDKTGLQNLIYIGGNSATIQTNTIYGQFVMGDPDVSRAMEVSAVTDLTIHGNTIYSLRQPAYINPATGTISDNDVYNTKGWVIVSRSNLTFTGNTWGDGSLPNYYDIAIIVDSPPGTNNYPDIVAMSAANNDAIIENQWYSPALLSIVHVDGNASASAENGSILDPYTTIGPAIPRVAAGGTINVAPATYTEELTIDKSLTLTGDTSGSCPGPGAAAPVLDGGGLVGSGITIAGGVSGVVIEGFEITNYRNRTLGSPWTTGGTGSAVLAWSSTAIDDVIVRDNYFHDLGWNAVLVGNEGQVLHDNWLVECNVADDCAAYAIELTNAKNSTVRDNDVTGGEDILGEADDDSQDGIIIQTQIHVGSGLTNTTITVEDNTVTGPLTRAGIELLAWDSTDSLTADLTDVDVLNNTVTGTARGLFVYAVFTNATIDNVTVNGNTFQNNDVQVRVSEYGSGTADVDIQVVLDNNTFDRAVVVDPGSPLLPTIWSSIQDAIDAASPGNTVIVAAGTYEEQVVIDEDDLHLVGSGSGDNPAVDSIIQSPVSLSSTFNSGFYDAFPIVSVLAVTGGSIEDLRIDGLSRGNANYKFMGIAFWNAGGDVDDCVVRNIQDTPFSGAQHGVGIYAYNNTGGPYTVNITDTDIDEYQKNGMALSGDNLTANVSGCTVTGKGAIPTTAQNGIQISYGAGGTIDGCTVSDHIYTGGSWASTGVLLLEGAGVAVTDTVITDNHPGVYCQDTNATFDGISVSNQDPDSWDGLYAYNTTGTLLSGAETPRFAAAPFGEANGAAGGPRAVMTVSVSDSSFVGHDKADSWGVSAFATGTHVVNLTVTTSTVKDWDSGIVAYDYGYGSPVNLTANYNQIISNVTYGFENTFNPTVMDAENNWWGAASGPLDPDGTNEADIDTCFDASTMSNTDGAGNAVTDLNVDYCPWLGGAGGLILEAADCQDDVDGGLSGVQIEVELWMRDVVTPVTGYTAFMQFDDSKLTFVGGAYENTPFPNHVPATIGLVGGYTDLLEAGGYMQLGDPDWPGVTGDALLATLVFTVVDECLTTDVTLESFGPFDSELSYNGVPVPTNLVDTPVIALDDTDPTIICPADVTVDSDSDLCTATSVALGTPTTDDNCSVFSVSNDGTEPYALGDTTVTWTVTDDCGNTATCTQTVTVEDSQDPTIICPADVTVNADAGVCTATGVALGTPTTDDNCSVAGVSNDAAEPYALGDTIVTWTVTDGSANTATCTQKVTVEAYNDVVGVVVELQGVDASHWPSSPLTRCIEFTAKNGTDCATPVHVSVEFYGAPAIGTAPTFEVECGNWTELCAKDEQHTLYDTQSLDVVGTEYQTTVDLYLLAGDTDNDSDVDIHDVTWLMYQWGLGGGAAFGDCPWDATRDADFSNNNILWVEDYNLLSGNWHEWTECTCIPAPGGDEDGGPSLASLSLATSELPPEMVDSVDLNRDGVVDYLDVREFEVLHGLPDTLSSKIKASTLTAEPAEKLRLQP